MTKELIKRLVIHGFYNGLIALLLWGIVYEAEVINIVVDLNADLMKIAIVALRNGCLFY